MINRLLSKVGCDSSSHLGKKEFFWDEFGLDVKKNFFMGSQVRHCNGLPRKVVKYPSLEVFEKYARGA